MFLNCTGFCTTPMWRIVTSFFQITTLRPPIRIMGGELILLAGSGIRRVSDGNEDFFRRPESAFPLLARHRHRILHRLHPHGSPKLFVVCLQVVFLGDRLEVANPFADDVHNRLSRDCAIPYASTGNSLKAASLYRVFSADYGRRSVPQRTNGKVSARLREMLAD